MRARVKRENLRLRFPFFSSIREIVYYALRGYLYVAF